MVSKGILIGVIVGIFFAGLGIGYVALQSTTPSSMMDSQQMQKQNEDKQTETTLPSYVQMVDGVQIVTINAKEFKFIPSEISINKGKTKFVLVNNGVGEHELVVYEASKKDIIDKAELAEDEETIEKNILFDIEEIYPEESGETDILNLQEGSYVMGCHVPGHYEAGMKGTIEIKP
ncbi:MAG: plastocyanin/azurin family copper-binding protein [Nitrosopumilus sp.]